MVGWPVLSLLVQTVVLIAADKPYKVQGLVGASIFLSPVIPKGFNTSDIFWRYISHTDELVASFLQGSRETKYQSKFFRRAQLYNNFTLEILNLEMGDTGIFSCLLVDDGGRMEKTHLNLTVYEAVSQPKVEVFASRGEAEVKECTVFLSCVTVTGSNVSYSWRVDSGKGILINATLYDGDRLLRVTLSPAEREVSYTCSVTNPVSQEETSVVPWNSCTVQPGADADVCSCRVITYIAVPLVLLITAVIAMVLLCTKVSGKSRERSMGRDEEEMLQHGLEARNEEQPEGALQSE